MKPKQIVVLSLLVLGVIVILQNTQVVTFRFLFWNLTMSRIILLLIILGIGVTAGYLWGRGKYGA